MGAGGNAVISLVFAEYLNRLFWRGSDVGPDGVPQWATKLTAVCAIAVVFVVCAATPDAAPRMAVLFTTVKVRARCSSVTTWILRRSPLTLRRSSPWYAPAAHTYTWTM